MSRVQTEKRESFSPHDWEALSRQVVALYDSGMQPAAISLRLRAKLAIVVKIISKRDQSAARADPGSAPRPWLSVRRERTTLADRVAEARRLHARGEPIQTIATRLHLSQADVRAALGANHSTETR